MLEHKTKIIQNDVIVLARITYRRLINQPYLTLTEKIKHCDFDIQYFNEHLNLVAFPRWNFQKNCPIICLNINYYDSTEILEGLFMGILFKNYVKRFVSNNYFPQNITSNYILYYHLAHNTKLGSYAIDFANDVKKLDAKK